MTCACGCALQLGPKDTSDAARCLALAGDKRWTVPDRTPATTPARRGPVEPMTALTCRRCGTAYQVPTYLAEFMATHRVVAKGCTSCVEAGA